MVSAGMPTVLMVGNYGPSIAAARSLARAGYRVVAGDEGDGSPVTRSRACHSVWRHPPIEDQDAFIGAVASKVAMERVSVILPLRPNHVELLARRRAELPGDVALALPDWSVVQLAIDKPRMYALASELGVPHRRTAVARDPDELAQAADAVGYPCVIRPSAETAARLPERRKAIILTGREEMAARLRTWPHGHDRLLVQGYAGRRRRNIHFAARNGRILARVQTEAVRTDREDGTGLGVDGRSVPPDARLDAHCEALVGRLGYTGVGLFQFMTPPIGEPSFLELNPRIGTALAFVETCGLDLAVAACRLASGRAWAPGSTRAYPVGRRYAWTTKDIFGLRVARSQGAVSRPDTLRWLGRMLRTAIRADVHLTWSWRDPLPTVAVLRELVRPLG
jgi:predicted ATP-grasp superfamily ATP-dependent carboligase